MNDTRDHYDSFEEGSLTKYVQLSPAHLGSLERSSFLLPGHVEQAALELADEGSEVLRINADGLRTRGDFFLELAGRLYFPPAWGQNWDALFDISEVLAERWPASVTIIVENMSNYAARDLPAVRTLFIAAAAFQAEMGAHDKQLLVYFAE